MFLHIIIDYRPSVVAVFFVRPQKGREAEAEDFGAASRPCAYIRLKKHLRCHAQLV